MSDAISAGPSLFRSHDRTRLAITRRVFCLVRRKKEGERRCVNNVNRGSMHAGCTWRDWIIRARKTGGFGAKYLIAKAEHAKDEKRDCLRRRRFTLALPCETITPFSQLSIISLISFFLLYTVLLSLFIHTPTHSTTNRQDAILNQAIRRCCFRRCCQCRFDRQLPCTSIFSLWISYHGTLLLE